MSTVTLQRYRVTVALSRPAGDGALVPPAAPVLAPVPDVVLLEPRRPSQRPSAELPASRHLPRRGVSAGVVVALVLAALVVGFLLGWSLARMTVNG